MNILIFYFFYFWGSLLLSFQILSAVAVVASLFCISETLQETIFQDEYLNWLDIHLDTNSIAQWAKRKAFKLSLFRLRAALAFYLITFQDSSFRRWSIIHGVWTLCIQIIWYKSFGALWLYNLHCLCLLWILMYIPFYYLIFKWAYLCLYNLILSICHEL